MKRFQGQQALQQLNGKGSLAIRPFLYNDLKHFGELFNFRILVAFFIDEVKKTLKFWVLGLYLFDKNYLSRF